MKRRKLMAIAGVAGAALLARKYITGGIESIAPPTSTVRTKEVTPNDEFYITHYDGVPEIDVKDWRLVVTGEVERELSLSFEDISAFPETTDYNTLICIGNGIGGDLIGNAKWKGIQLKDVLLMAGLKETAKDIVFHGVDGYADSFPIEKALHEDSRLVYEMNDETLPPVHGFPLRAVIPGLYGIKNVKWIERIEVSAEDVKGYWQKRGWSERGIINVMSRIDVPRDGEIITGGSFEISGIAFGGENPITKVEVSTDGGKTWQEAALKPSLSRYAWTLWQYRWKITGPGDVEITARATDESGRVQKEGTVISRRSFPDGAEGYHTIKVTAVGI
jgi:DMSO/TMAO reductase YedYZ molybdopterin-dependent catalytic subunit